MQLRLLVCPLRKKAAEKISQPAGFQMIIQNQDGPKATAETEKPSWVHVVHPGPGKNLRPPADFPPEPQGGCHGLAQQDRVSGKNQKARAAQNLAPLSRTEFPDGGGKRGRFKGDGGDTEIRRPGRVVEAPTKARLHLRVPRRLQYR